MPLTLAGWGGGRRLSEALRTGSAGQRGGSAPARRDLARPQPVEKWGRPAGCRAPRRGHLRGSRPGGRSAALRLGPWCIRPAEPAQETVCSGCESSSVGAGGAWPAPCDGCPRGDSTPTRGLWRTGRPRPLRAVPRPPPPQSLRGTWVVRKIEPEDRPEKAWEAGGPGGEAVSGAEGPPAQPSRPSPAPLLSCDRSWVTSARPGGSWQGSAVRCPLVFRQKSVSYPTKFSDSTSLLSNAAPRQQLAFMAVLHHFVTLQSAALKCTWIFFH